MRTLSKIEYVAPFPIYDITVDDDHCFELENGVIAHNSKAVVSGGCVVENTLITMFDGSLKPVQEIVVNELVMTKDGIKPVTAIWNPETLIEGEPECYEIVFEDGYVVTCSDKHKFLINGNWVEAKDLVVGDEVQKIQMVTLKIAQINKIGRRKVYDISVQDSESYVLENGVITHNTGGIYSSNTIFIIGKAQEKEDNEIAGYKFTINVEKSRFVREKSKFPFIVTYERGVNIWSGLLDIAQETGHVIKPKVGWYSRPSVENDKSWRAKDTNCSAFWKPIFENTDFKEVCHKRYALGETALLTQEPEDQVSNIDLESLED